MTQRSVFKLFSSLGPAGSLVSLTEKFCRRFFNEAYELGDPTANQGVEEEHIRNTR